ANAVAGPDRRREAHSLKTVIEPALNRFQMPDAMAQMRNQREGEEAMGDRAPLRHFAAGAFNIDMDPLVVTGRRGKGINARLFDFDPIARSQFLADRPLQFFRRLEYAHAATCPSLLRRSL